MLSNVPNARGRDEEGGGGLASYAGQLSSVRTDWLRLGELVVVVADDEGRKRTTEKRNYAHSLTARLLPQTPASAFPSVPVVHFRKISPGRQTYAVARRTVYCLFQYTHGYTVQCHRETAHTNTHGVCRDKQRLERAQNTHPDG